MAEVEVQHQSHIGGSGISPDGTHLLPTSLYVGDLEMGVTDSQLHDLFVQTGKVLSVRVCRDLATKRSLGYGYVNFGDPDDAARALGMLNLTPINGKPIRIMYSHRDPSLPENGPANVFIKNLDKSIDNMSLQETFSTFGNILSCKVATDESGESKGYGFVQFDSEESAGKAIEKLNGMLLNDKQIFVGPFVSKEERDAASSNAEFNNVFVKNLLEATTEDDLNKIFGEFGPITSSVVMRNGDGKSKCFGFVNFKRGDDAARSVAALNGKTFEDREWYVGKAQKKAERVMVLKERFAKKTKEAVDRYKGVNLYVKNIDDSITDEKLTELFSPFGAISSCKVARCMNGVSKGSGFVAFSNSEDASRAIAGMNGKMVISKPLYVAVAQRKEDRKAMLKAQFSQRGMAAPAGNAQSVAMYPAGQQTFYARPRPEIAPPRLGFGGYQQQMMRPSGPLMPEFFVPMVQQLPMHNQQHMMRQGTVSRYPVIPNPCISALDGGMSVPFRDASTSPSPHVPTLTTLASALASASPDQQRTILGENLHPLVEKLEGGDMATKVTGMLLEMDQTKVLHLLESPDSLKSKVTEAIDVLTSVAQETNSASDRLASLSLVA